MMQNMLGVKQNRFHNNNWVVYAFPYVSKKLRTGCKGKSLPPYFPQMIEHITAMWLGGIS